MSSELTSDRLKEWLHYDLETGVFRWRVPTSRMSVGDVAGVVNSRGYLQIGLGGSLYQAHRLAWLWVHGEWPANDIDHINRDRTDNRLANLREATRSQNLSNAGRRRDNVSGFKGVGWFKPMGKWRARIALNKRVHHLGYFDTAEEAHAAYVAASNNIHGEFARAA